jgi:hypothetical protein
MEDEFILIGWVNLLSNPIIVPKNVQWISRECPLNLYKMIWDIGSVGGVRLYIILPQLYKLENIRNLDLYEDLLHVPNTLLLDANCNVVLNGRGYTEGSKTKEEYYEFYKDIIRGIEINYPGLLKPIYLGDVVINNQEEQLRGGKRGATKRHIKTRKSNTKRNK